MFRRCSRACGIALIGAALLTPLALAQTSPTGIPGVSVPQTTTPSASPPAPLTSTASAPTSAPADIPPGGGDPYAVRLAKLEDRVNELKDEAFNVKAKVDLLKETVLHGTIGGSRAFIVHDNKMSSVFRLQRLVYALDGVRIAEKSDDVDHIGDQKEIPIFDGQIVPGEHILSVQIVYTGNGYSVFSYLRGYTFTVKSSQAFSAGEGKQTRITVSGYEKGNFTTDLKDRPAVQFDVNMVDDSSAQATVK